MQACREAAGCDELFSTSSPCIYLLAISSRSLLGEEKGGLGTEQSLSSQAAELVRRPMLPKHLNHPLDLAWFSRVVYRCNNEPLTHTHLCCFLFFLGSLLLGLRAKKSDTTCLPLALPNSLLLLLLLPQGQPTVCPGACLSTGGR